MVSLIYLFFLSNFMSNVLVCLVNPRTRRNWTWWLVFCTFSKKADNLLAFRMKTNSLACSTLIEIEILMYIQEKTMILWRQKLLEFTNQAPRNQIMCMYEESKKKKN